MAENAMNGIMSLPESKEGREPQVQVDPELFSPEVSSYARNNPVEFGENVLKGMEQNDPALIQQFRQELSRLSLPPEAIDALGQMVDLILDAPESYDEIREGLLKEGVPEDLLPEEFDLAFFTAMNIALDQLSMALPGDMGVAEEEFEPFPINRAEGGIAELKPMAAAMANMGRNGDSMLAHITPSEARLLRRRGGSGTINPYTGLPEFFFGKIFKAIGKAVKGVVKVVGKVVKGVVNIVKKVAKSPIGKIALTAAGIWALGPAGLNLAGGIGSTFGISMTPALAMGINTFAANTVVNLAGGQSLGDAVKNGAIAGVLAGGVSKLSGWAPESYKTAYGAPDASAAVEAATSISPGGATSAEALYNPESMNVNVGDVASGAGQAATSAASGAASATQGAGEGLLSKAWNWAKANPVPAALAGTGAVLAVDALTGNALTTGEPAEIPEGFEHLAKGPGKTGIDLYNENPDAYRMDFSNTARPADYGVDESRAQDPNYDRYSGYAAGGYVQEYNIGGPAFPETPLSYSPNQMSAYGGNYMPPPPFSFARGGNVPDPRDPSNFPRRTGAIAGPGTPTSDSIPAMLSDGEFVFTKRAVDGAAKLANGGMAPPSHKARKDGAREMYSLMKTLEGLA